MRWRPVRVIPPRSNSKALELFNSGTIAAIGSSGANATVDLDNSVVFQGATGRIVASGNAVVDFSTSIIEGGTLATVGSNASAGVFDPGAEGDLIDVTVAAEYEYRRRGRVVYGGRDIWNKRHGQSL